VTEPQHRSAGRLGQRAPRTEAAPTPEPEARSTPATTPAMGGLAVRRLHVPGVPSAGALEQSVAGQAPGSRLNQIESAFGRHDVSGVLAHAGGAGAAAAGRIGAEAFATGRDIALGGAAAAVPHEAAHVAQQRAGALPAMPEAAIPSVLEQDSAAVIGHPAPRADAQR
jgi:hypothetical protein